MATIATAEWCVAKNALIIIVRTDCLLRYFVALKALGGIMEDRRMSEQKSRSVLVLFVLLYVFVLVKSTFRLLLIKLLAFGQTEFNSFVVLGHSTVP